MRRNAQQASVFWNGSGSSHQRSIANQLKHADQFECAVAFAKMSGFEKIERVLVSRLKKGMKARIIVGLSFYQTEPAVLEKLLSLQRKYNLEAFVSNPSKSKTFHPKIYRFKAGRKISTIVGSANLTAGGLASNFEISALSYMDSNARLLGYLDSLVQRKDVVPLKKSTLDKYRQGYAIVGALSKLAQKKIAKSLAQRTGGLNTLDEILQEMKKGGAASEFNRDTKMRARNYAKARQILKKIQKSKRLSTTGFLSLYERLVEGLWHSGGLSRNKTRVAKKPSHFQQMINGAEAAAQANHSISRTYDRLSKIASSIPGAGPNVVTELLHTLDNTKYAVMNKNSVAGLQLAGFQQFPARPTRDNVVGADYEKFCGAGIKIRKRLKLKNLSELDALFNFAYWGDD